jgi:hypothetical protein
MAKGGQPRNDAISGDELRRRIKALDLTYAEAATRLGLSLAALNKQMRADTGVSRQTALLLDCLEQHQRKRGARRLLGAAAVAAILMSANTSAETIQVPAFENGDSLYKHCTAPTASFTDPTASFFRGVCAGYVIGIVDAMASPEGTPVAGVSACPPRDADIGHAVDVVTQFLASDPERGHRAATGLVAQALAQTFPCPKSQQQPRGDDSQAAYEARLRTWCPMYQMCERYAKAVERCTPGSANYDACMKIMMPGGENYQAAASCRGDGSLIRPPDDLPYRWVCALNGYGYQ